MLVYQRVTHINPSYSFGNLMSIIEHHHLPQTIVDEQQITILTAIKDGLRFPIIVPSK